MAILVAFLVRAFVLQTFYIPSPSMQHTLELWDRVLVNKLVYDFREPRRGEIIVFKAPTAWQSGADGEDFIKRVIGQPGDNVVCCDQQQRLVINGKSLDEPYVYVEADGTRNQVADQNFDITVPEGRLWVMGDHREASGDSLEHYEQSGAADEAGKIQDATIPVDSVVGRAFTIFWPASRATWLTVPGEFDSIPDAGK
ncbi:signal peptidase I [Actinoplanes campanulatus]|uniref:Signal peptidase I n=1 Tax=Actinoplanes campanulatus TaxID=113559 RepID=A0A7W5AB91_9ACTN|nr:signal peptidase I [Actinoplanes campanulatus]